MGEWVEFEWNEANENKIIDEHNVYPDEAEEAVRDDPDVVAIPVGKGRTQYIGKTEGGRLLGVILEQKSRYLVRVITAYEAGSRLKSIYRRRNR